MTTLNDVEKLNYINSRFHQYFDLGINTNITTTEKVNLVIPIQKLFDLGDSLSTTEYSHDIEIGNDFDINECLAKYNDTDIKKEVEAVCTRVIDGDTIKVRIINDDGTTTDDVVGFVGVNTPEQNIEGYESSKKFVEKACYTKKYFNYLLNPENIKGEVFNNKHIYLNIDNKKKRDIHGRLLAVVIVDNKNLNEVLLKEKIAEVEYIPPSEFNPNDWKDVGTSIHVYKYKNDDLGLLSPYLNANMNNIVFTPANDTNTLYRYEIYQGIIFLQLKPYSQYIRMHILPKAYNCSNSVLIFKDKNITKDNINKSSNYKVYEERNNINAYFQENGEDRNRNDIANRSYTKNDWAEDSVGISNTFVEFSYDISNSTESFTNLQICAGYRYNQTSPYYALHYTGVKDNYIENDQYKLPQERCSLVDANIDNIKGNSTHIITQFDYYNTGEEDIIYLKHDPEIRKEISTVNHTSEIGILHHKILKYINDALYVEEEGFYGLQNWVDRFVENNGGS